MDNCIDGITEVGAWFSATNPFYANALPLILNPQFENNVPLIIDSGWKEVSGSFVAAGGEQYIIIGSFRPDSQLTFTPAPAPNSWFDVYYFVDDVSVIRDSTVGVTEMDEHSFNFHLFPNPVVDYVNVTIVDGLWTNGEIEITNVTGRKVFQTSIIEAESKINLSDLSSGMYFLSVKMKEKFFTRKFVKR